MIKSLDFLRLLSNKIGGKAVAIFSKLTSFILQYVNQNIEN